MRLRLVVGAVCSMMLLPAASTPRVFAQQTSTPGLHRRSDGSSADQPEERSGSKQTSTLPPDVSGSYHFTHYNDSIEIDIRRNRLSGYVSQLGDAETDSNTPLTFFFDKTSIDGSRIGFETRVVHGVWYSFHGTIYRGDAQRRDQDGYYILHGALLVHHPQSGDEKSADETIERRVVNFKSMGR